MGLIQRVVQKIAMPKYDRNKFKSSNLQDKPTSRELRYRTLQNVFSILSSEIDYEKMTQKVVDVMVEEMDFLGGVLFLPNKDSNAMIAWSFTGSRLGKTVTSWLPKPFREHLYSLTLPNNLVVKAFLEKKIFLTKRMSELVSPAVSEKLADTMQKFMGMELCVALPVIYQNKTLGVLMFTSTRKETSDEEMEMLKTFANQVSIAINNTKVFTETKNQVTLLEQQNHDIQSLYNLTSRISESLDPSRVAQNAVDSLPQDEVMLGGILTVLSADKTKLLTTAVTRNRISDAVKGIIGDFSQYVMDLTQPSTSAEINRTIFKQNRPFSTTDLADIISPPVPKRFVGPINAILKIKSAVVFPIYIRGEAVGTITYFLKNVDFKTLTEDRQRLFQTYTSQIAIALENSNLYRNSQIIQSNLQKALTDLQESRRRERDMIDIMGHELRTPMSIVRNALSMMDLIIRKEGQIPSDKQKKYVDIGLESARREANLIETLLSATKADAKGFQLTFEKVDLFDAVNDSLVGFTSQAKKKGLELTFEKDPAMAEAFIYCDRTRIQEIMDNFVSNAVKYTYKGFVKIRIEKRANMILTIVEDSGLGISKEDLSHLGKKFFRAKQYSEGHGANVIRPGGTGLGLYVAFALIKLMDGEFEIISELEKGSKFTFGMPGFSGQPLKQEERKVQDYQKAVSN